MIPASFPSKLVKIVQIEKHNSLDIGNRHTEKLPKKCNKIKIRAIKRGEI